MMKASIRLPSDGTSVVTRVAWNIRERIVSRQLPRGALLPSYRDLAAELNVGYTTIKLAMDLLSKQGIVTRERARGCYVSRELSPHGKALKTVGIIHTASYAHLFSTPYLQQIMRGIGEGPSHLDVHIYNMRGDGFVTAAQLADRHVDGVILLGLESDAFVEEFATWGIPGVLVDQVSEKVSLDCVACDNDAAARQAVRRLVELGHRHIRYVACDPRRITQVGATRTLLLRSSDRAERREAATRALAAIAGMRWDEDILAIVGDQGLVSGVVSGWREESDRPTAFLVDAEQLGGELMREFAVQGVKVPKEVSVCVMARKRSAGLDGAMAGCGFDFVEMGRKAVAVLRRRCERSDKAPAPTVYRIGCEWVEGSSARARRVRDQYPLISIQCSDEETHDESRSCSLSLEA